MIHINLTHLTTEADNQGAHCIYCQQEGRYNEVNVYTTEFGEREIYNCCRACVVGIALEFHRSPEPVLVEVGKK